MLSATVTANGFQILKFSVVLISDTLRKDISTIKEDFVVDVTAEKLKRNSSVKKCKMSFKGRIFFSGLVFGVLLVSLLSALLVVAVLILQKENGSGTWTTAVTTPGTTGQSGATVVSPTPEPAQYRLSKTIIPSHYQLFLHVHLPYDEAEEVTLPDAFTTKGSHVAITLTTASAGVNQITLHTRHDSSSMQSGHIKKFTKEAVTVSLPDGTAGPSVSEIIFEPADILTVRMAANLTANTSYALKIYFDGVIADDNEGLYRSSYLNAGGEKRWLVISQLHAYKARRVFPCFDEPGFRSVFSTTLLYDTRFTRTRTNGQKLPGSSTNATWTTSEFAPTPNMPVYLNAFLVVGDDFGSQSWTVVEGPVAAPPIKTYPLNVLGNNVLLDQGQGTFAGQHGKDVMERLFEQFGQTYPLQKLDMAGVPDFTHGAMENWGLVLYRESSIMYRPNVSTADDKRNVAAIVAHELAHMIFGDLVTYDWWSDSWLTEGFARFMQYELMQQTRPLWGVENLFPYWVVREAMQPDSYETSHALTDDSVENLAQIDNMFDTITYAKGASIIHMLKGIMQSDRLYSGLRAYVAKYAFSTVVANDLLRELDGVMDTGANLTGHMDSWIRKRGYPVVTLTRGAFNTDISYMQDRFLLPVGTVSLAPSSTIWHIPLTLTHGAETASPGEQSVHKGCWLTKRTGQIVDECAVGLLTYPPNPADAVGSDNYIIANAQQYGFYRVNYDETNWNRIIMALNAPVPNSLLSNDSVTRGQLIDDAFFLARAGKLKYEIPVYLMNGYMASTEKSYSPLASAMDNIRYIDQMLRDTMDHQPFFEYMARFISILYRPSMWETPWQDAETSDGQSIPENEADYDQLMFNNLVIETACYYGVRTCLDDAKSKFDDWRTNGVGFGPDPTASNTVQARSHVFCYGIRDGPVSNFVYLLDMYNLTSTTNSNKLSILRGLACTSDELLLQKVLDMVIDGRSVRPQDANTVFGYVSRFATGSSLVWEYVQTYWSVLTRRSALITDVTGSFTGDRRLTQVKSLFASAVAAGGPGIGEGPAFLKAIARIEANNMWTLKYARKIVDLLSQLSPGSNPSLQLEYGLPV